VGFISQSGTHGMNFSLTGAAQGVICSKLISFGNGIILEAADYLEYLADDDDTKFIGMYIEGARDGPRLIKALRYAAAKKPVVTWKGGQTAAGSRATQSHTASLATNQAVWESIVRQCGALAVDSLDEMVDVMKALRLSKPAKGRGVGLLAMTGGQSVVMTDAFAKEGWDIPTLSDTSYEKFAEFFNVIGGSYQNPLDMAGTIGQDPKNFDTILEILDEDPALDALVMELSATFMARRWKDKPEELERLLDSIVNFRERSDKPILTVLHPSHLEAEALEVRLKLQERGIAVFANFERAANAMAKVATLAESAS
jgi:acyl-CoA synthetase (NDP forming)